NRMALASAYRAIGQEAEALKLYEDVLERRTRKPGQERPDTLLLWTMINLAELLATASDAKLQDPSRALDLANKAVESLPNELEFWGTRGIARYGAGDWKGAKADLQKANELRTLKTPDDFHNQAQDGFFLAMALYQLGEKNEARKRYDQAVDCLE